ncbi:lipid-binding SYLF domain-containing protein [Mucilaginibacter gracilis]|uniref:Lipid-binding SYLF domain-containing protein n=1 Tax=Mucilaginibacter gracilis TaxID=423350 RepID=A0A495J741_9SPHI|nr:lipid-binding SYLF domain-containing protein [Mucilaginibacter gracilis]RKR84816.1 lipid-binding SYLF domain-containing protein [Mucilaginibacter gracilis]
MKTLKLFRLPAMLLLASVMMLTTVSAQDKEHDKIEDATGVLRDFGKMKESIPRELLEKTNGIIIIPKLINAGFVIGGKRGKGIAMVKLPDGKWSNPVFVTMTGGSFGLQAGVQSVDLVLVFKSAKTLHRIGTGSFTLGGDISAAAGPVGRSSSANTDYKLEAEVYSYSRSRGLFAGISINGAKLDIDAKADNAFYGQSYSARTLFAGTDKTSENSVKELKETLRGLY